MVPKSRSRSQKVGEYIVALFLVGIVAYFIPSWLGFSWTSFLSGIAREGFPSWTGFSTKTLWDWLQLLIIPFMLVVGGYWLNQLQKRREDRITQGQKEVEQNVATDNQRESLLQAYLDKMSELLVEKQLHESAPEDKIREIARVRTLTVLDRLNGPRKRNVLQFLHDAGLIDKDKHIIDLHGADLRATNFSEANLFSADLGGANLRGADLFAADLSGAKLVGADLAGARLSRAKLVDADLAGARLNEAKLVGADLAGARLNEAKLVGTDLSGAYLGSVDLSGATLDGADLGDARATTEFEASAKDEVTLKLPELPNADAKYAHLHRSSKVRGPLRTFGGPLRLPCSVTYTTDEETVMYIQHTTAELVLRLILPTLILLGLIICVIISVRDFSSLTLFIILLVLMIVFTIVSTIVNHIDSVFILTTKRIIDIDRTFLFSEEHISAEYTNIRDVTAFKANPVLPALDVGTVTVETAGDNPNIEISLVDHPFSIRDMIFRIINHMEKKEERK